MHTRTRRRPGAALLTAGPTAAATVELAGTIVPTPGAEIASLPTLLG